MLLPDLCDTISILVIALLLHRTHATFFGLKFATQNNPPDIDLCNATLIVDSLETNVRNHVRCACIEKKIDCSDLELSAVPTGISFSQNIQTVSFQGNHLKNVKDDSFRNGRNVTELNLSNNRIDFISINALDGFQKLQRLLLHHNALWHLSTDAFSNLTQLKLLDLSYNDLNSMTSESFRTIVNLEELRLKANPIGQIDVDQFKYLPKLKFLDLESTMLQEIPDHLFTFTTKLTILNMANNLLPDVPTAALKHLKKLKNLNLNGNKIKVIDAEAFSGLSSLRLLYLDHMPELLVLRDYSLGDLQSLQELHCSYNLLLSQIQEKAFVSKDTGHKIEVQQVFLRQNSLQQIPRNLLKWSDSMELYLRGNPWNCDCQMAWIVDIKLRNHFETEARCSSPASVKGQTFSSLKGQELPCGPTIGTIAIISFSVVIAVVIVIIIITFFGWKRSFGRTPMLYFRVKKKSSVDEMEYESDETGILYKLRKYKFRRFH